MQIKKSLAGLLLFLACSVHAETLEHSSNLPYTVVDAEYSKSLDRIVMISASPDQLHIFDPIGGQETGTVDLPKTPYSVSVSPDGLFAAVGHDDLISYINLGGNQLLASFPLSIRMPDVVMSGDGRIYAFHGNGFAATPVPSIEVATGKVSQGSGVAFASVGKRHPSGNALYSTDRCCQRINKFVLSSGPPRLSVSSDDPQTGGCGNLWISDDGLRIFSACGTVYRASESPAQDLRYNGRLSQTFSVRSLADSATLNSLVVINGGPSRPMDNDNELHLYDYESLTFQERLQLPQNAHGRFVFFNRDGNRFFVIALLDDGASGNIVLDYAAGTRSRPAQRLSEPGTMLGYSVNDAAYSKSLKRIVTISESPNRLHLLDPETQEETAVVPLGAPPRNLSLSPDGRFVAVNHTRSISWVDLSSAAVIKVLVPSFEVAYVGVGNNGIIQAVPLTIGNAMPVIAINIATGVETRGTFLLFSTRMPPKVDPAGKYMYLYEESSSFVIQKFRIDSGRPEFLYTSSFSDSNTSSCRNVWISENASFLVSACGKVVTLSETRAMDLMFTGRLAGVERAQDVAHSAASRRLAVLTTDVPFDSNLPIDIVLRTFDDQRMTLTGSRVLPAFVVRDALIYKGHGRYVFFSDDGRRSFVLLRAEDSAGVLFDYAIATLPIDSASPMRTLLNDRTSVRLTSTDTASSLVAGSLSVLSDADNQAPGGVATISFRQNNVTVTEAAVPATAPIRSGIMYVEVTDRINTGVAMANPWDQPVSVRFYYTNAQGRSPEGIVRLPAKGQIAAFINQSPFSNAGFTGAGTLTFSADMPVSIVALRGLTNERSEFLLTTLPVINLEETSTEMAVFPHFAVGAGWQTELVLINPTNQVLSGSLEFMAAGRRTQPNVPALPITVAVNGEPGSSFEYSIPAEGIQRFDISTTTASVQSGSIRVRSLGTSPAGVGIFELNTNGITVTTAGVPASRAGGAFRLFAESVRQFGPFNRGSFDTGVAVTNLSSEPANVTLEVFSQAGSQTNTISLPGNGQVSGFLSELGVGLDGQYGLLRVSTSSPSGISVTGLRGRYNERDDFLISTTPAFPEDQIARPVMMFPHFAQGGGYTTQFGLITITPSRASIGTIDSRTPSGAGIDLLLR